MSYPFKFQKHFPLFAAFFQGAFKECCKNDYYCQKRNKIKIKMQRDEMWFWIWVSNKFKMRLEKAEARKEKRKEKRETEKSLVKMINYFGGLCWWGGNTDRVTHILTMYASTCFSSFIIFQLISTFSYAKKRHKNWIHLMMIKRYFTSFQLQQFDAMKNQWTWWWIYIQSFKSGKKVTLKMANLPVIFFIHLTKWTAFNVTIKWNTLINLEFDSSKLMSKGLTRLHKVNGLKMFITISFNHRLLPSILWSISLAWKKT